MTMPAREVQPGDVLTTESGNLIVKGVRSIKPGVSLLLAEGRTDPGTWSSLYLHSQPLDIYRAPKEAS